MSARPAATLVLVAALLLGAGVRAGELLVDGKSSTVVEQGQTIELLVTGDEGAPAWLVLDVLPGPSELLGQAVEVGASASQVALPLGPLPPGGRLGFEVRVPAAGELGGLVVYAVAAIGDVSAPFGFAFSAGVSIRIVDRAVQIAGNPLASHPHFEFVRAFPAGAPLHVAVDTGLHPAASGRTAEVYVVAARTPKQWLDDSRLVDLSADGPERHTFVAGGLAANTLVVDPGTLVADVFPAFGTGYDVVVDLDRDGLFDGDDLIDGFDTDEAGLYVVPDTTAPGPLAVTEVTYSGGAMLGQNTFYPTETAALGALPLVVVSHGNGHNFQWYDHIGRHLASWGYIVMSHQNNTGPGVEAASLTTLSNTDWFLGNLDLIAEGELLGHVDGQRITWMGHSRGGEGIVIAYDALWKGLATPEHFTLADVALLSSMAPTAFRGKALSNPHGVDYHLWVGGADADVTGCCAVNATQPFHLHDRAAQRRLSTSLHGVGHGDFHNSSGSVANGPCLVGKADTHRIQLGYLLPLLEHHIRGSPAAEDFLWRPWERFHPIGAPVSDPCVVVDLQFRQGLADGKFVIDDFQTGVALSVSSSGGAVAGTVTKPLEGLLTDEDGSFADVGLPFNGFTAGRPTDDTRGLAFEYDGDAELEFEIAPEGRNAARFRWLSLRACQVTRHPLTTSEQADLVFSVELVDGGGRASSLRIDAYGGGVEEPYQRGSCGLGLGWANEFETVRVRLTDFLAADSGLDLADLVKLRLRFGPSWGSARGRLGLDDIEFTAD